MSQPLVSILIPCRDAEPWLEATLRSALGQSCKECEVIVVDDGSTDRSAEIARRYAVDGVQLVQQAGSGAAAARNTALRLARGAFLQYLDADDLLDAQKIAVQLERLARAPARSVAAGAWVRFTGEPNDDPIPDDPLWRDSAPLDWLVRCWDAGGMMHPAAWLTPREVAERAGPWNEALSLDDDGEYFCRVLLASAGMVFCREARSFYRTHAGGSLSHAKTLRAWQSSHEMRRLVESEALAAEDSPRVRHACAMNHLQFAFAAWPYREARELARESLKRARRLDPQAQIPKAGPRFSALARIVGWRLARRIQGWRLPKTGGERPV